MKIATIIIRTLIGLLMLFASISYFFKLFPEHVLTGDFKIFNDGVVASVYLMPLVKTIELICGLAFVTGKFMKIAPIVLLPITVNIFLIHAFLEPSELAVVTALFIGNIFLIYVNWNSYKALFAV